MSNGDTISALTELASLSIAEVTRRRDELIHNARDQGASVAEIMAVAGFSREASVYEAIKRHRERGE